MDGDGHARRIVPFHIPDIFRKIHQRISVNSVRFRNLKFSSYLVEGHSLVFEMHAPGLLDQYNKYDCIVVALQFVVNPNAVFRSNLYLLSYLNR